MTRLNRRPGTAKRTQGIGRPAEVDRLAPEARESLDPKHFEGLVDQGDWPQLRGLLETVPAQEIADLLPQMARARRALLFRVLPRTKAAQTFSHLGLEDQQALLRAMSDEETRHMLAALRPDDRTQVLTELPSEVTRRVMRLLSPDDLREARQLMGYPDESVGRLMTPDYVAVGPDWTAARTLEHIRKTGRDSETTNVVLVTDEDWRFLGTVRLRQIILAAPVTRVKDLMDTDAAGLSAFEDREEAVRVMRKYDLFVLPVTDSEGTLVGIVTADDVLDVAEEEFTEDFHKFGATTPLEMSYRDANVRTLYGRRVGWLGALIVVGVVSSGVILLFEDVLVTVLTLALFIPLLMGTGGNTGSQAATIMVRALATGDLAVRDWVSGLAKELAVGILLGVSLGLVASLVGILRGGITIAMIVGVSMTVIVVVANLIGFLLPLILTRMRLDPAAASSPLVTSIMDVIGLLIYFGIATVFIAVNGIPI